MARRINTKFLGLAVASVVGVGVAGYVAQRVLVRENPQTYIDTGKRLMAERQWRGALENFYKAARVDSSNPETQVLIADAIEPLRENNPEMGRAQYAALQRALEIDPKYMPALHKMLVILQQDAFRPQKADDAVASADRAAQIANRIAEQDASDVDIAALKDLLPVRLWLTGVAISDERIRVHMDSLDALVERKPDSIEIFYIASQAHLKRGIQMRLAGQLKEVYEQEQVKAVAIIESALAGSEKVLAELEKTSSATTAPTGLPEARGRIALVYARASEIYSRLERTVAAEGDKAGAKPFADKADAAVARAESLTTPNHPQYSQIHVQSATLRVQRGDGDGAEAKLRDLVENQSGDPFARQAFARVLSRDPEKLDEAISNLIVARDTASKSPRYRPMENDLLQLIIEMQLQKYARMSASPERDDVLKLVRENTEDLESRTGEVALTLTLRGRVQMATGQSVDAIQTLSRARVQANQNNPGGADNNLLIMLVQAYIQTQQTGQARQLLQEVIDRAPDLIPARVMYTQLLLQANDRDAAKAQIATLEKQSPDLPELNRLKLALLDPKKDTKQIDTLVGQLGEEDRSQRLAKAQAALALQRPTEAQRLLDLILASDPADTEAAELLAKVHLASGDRTSAERVLTEALAKQPGQPRLTILLEAARGASPAQLAQTRRDLIEKTTDEFTREMQLFDLERDANDLDKAMGHLRRAREIKPDDAQATDLMFQTLLARREFTEAEKLLPALTTANRDQANGLLYAIKLEQVRGDTGKAIQLARELTRRLPEFAVSHFTLGQSLQQAGAFEDALSKYAVALEKRPNDIEAIRASVRCFYGLNRPDEAKRYIEQGLKLQPNDEQLRDMLVKHYLNNRESEKAIPMLQDAAQKNPSNPGTLKGLSVAYFRAAREKAITGDGVTAERYIKLARDTLNAGVATWPDDREFYAYLADIQLNANDAAGGEKTLLALSNRPAWKQRPEPRLMLAEFYAKANRLDEAEKSMREALEISSNSVDVQLPLANFLAQRGKSDESLKLLESANTGDPRVERQRIETLINFGKSDEAEKSIEGALSRLGASTRPAATVTADRVELLALSGLSAMNQLKFDVALQRLDTALAFDNRNARALFWRGLTRLRQPKPDVNAALVDLQAARDVTPDNVEVRLTLADAYNAAGDPDGSTRELETALNLSPLNKIARLRLIGMYSASKPPRWREVEQLLVEASQVPQFSRDADWPNAESSMWMVRGDFDKAMKANQAAQQLSPGNPSIIGNYLQILLASRNYDVLIRETDKIMKDNGDIWWLRLARAQAKRAKEDKPGAMDELVAALGAADAQKDETAQTRVIQSIAQLVGIDDAIGQIVPRAGTDARWLIPLAVLHQSKGDFASARTTADQIMARLDQFEAPRKPAALRTAGMIYLTAQPFPRVDEAADAYDRLLAIEPEDMTALNNLAYLWVKTASPQDPKRALNYSRRAYEMLLRRGAFEPMIYDTHGWVLFKNGRVDEAVDILRQVVDRAPFLEAHYHLAEVYLYKSFPEEAQKQLAAAQDLLTQAERDQRPVDPKIKKSVNDALERTQKALSDKAQALAP